jgi:choice-of-anchor B domain-containing protein
MQKLILVFFLILSIRAFSQTAQLTFASSWKIDSLNDEFKDIWGYHANGREYAITGTSRHIFFLDVTDPFTPDLIVTFEPGLNTPTRDFKTYKDRAYAVSGGGGNQEGLIIFDLSKLPFEVTKTYQSTDLVPSTHNFFIDEETGRLYTTNGHVLDLSQTPDNPVLLAEISEIRGHDLFVRNDFAYVSKGHSGYYIYDVADLNNPKLLAQLQTNGYNHSSWLTEDNRYAIFAEESFGLPLGVMDLQRMEDNDLEIISLFKEPLLAPDYENVVAHNPFVRENFLFVSYYEDGVVVFDISDIEKPKRIAYYDTYPDNTTYTGFKGCWGVYPFLPSGTIIASDQTYGLFVFQFDGFKNEPALRPEVDINCLLSPNPADDEISVWLSEPFGENETQLKVYNAAGQAVMSKALNQRQAKFEFLPVRQLPSGLYWLEIQASTGRKLCKFVKR